jgi:hypothetical protein
MLTILTTRSVGRAEMPRRAGSWIDRDLSDRVARTAELRAERPETPRFLRAGSACMAHDGHIRRPIAGEVFYADGTTTRHGIGQVLGVRWAAGAGVAAGLLG